MSKTKSTTLNLVRLAVVFFSLLLSTQAQNITADRLNFNIPTEGAVKSMVLGRYGLSYFSYDFGVPRHDDVLCFGYNCGGPEFDPLEPQWSMAWENYFTTSEGRTQSEFYFTAGLGSIATRPFSIDFYHDTATTQVGIFSRSFVVGDPLTGMPWLRLTTTPAGDMTFLGDSGINYSGTREFLLSRHGIGILGSTSATQWSLFSGGITGETLNIFRNSATDMNTPLTIKLGSTSGGGSLRVRAGQWQVSTPTGFADIQTKPTPCEAIPNANPRSTLDVGRAINQVLDCLRKQGIVAQGGTTFRKTLNLWSVRE